MLGENRYRIIHNADMSEDRRKSLLTFYLPLIGTDALALYEYGIAAEKDGEYRQLDELLLLLGLSIDDFEEAAGKLNEYKLMATYKKKDEDVYLFSFKEPKNMQEFTDDDLYVRDFILKAGGSRYQAILSTLAIPKGDLSGFENVSRKYDLRKLDTWSKEDETFLSVKEKEEMAFDSLFDVNVFLKDMSDFLFPLRYRTYDNLKEIATLADLYNISYDKMRTIISRVLNKSSDRFDLKELAKLCQSARTDYVKAEDGNYGVPCTVFLMNKQGGKEVTPYDKKILYALSNEYKLSPGVINVLLEYALKQCGNHLYPNFIYAAASDLHRNNVTDAKTALELLGSRKVKETVKDELPTYDSTRNPEVDEQKLQELLSRRKK